MRRTDYFQTEHHFQVPSITAPFQRVEAAQAAAEALEAAGFPETRLDSVQSYPAVRGDVTGQPFPQSLTDQGSTDQRFFSAADDAISGLAADELLGEAPYVLTVVLPDPAPETRQRALEILRRHGADVGLGDDLRRSDRWDPQAPEA